MNSKFEPPTPEDPSMVSSPSVDENETIELVDLSQVVGTSLGPYRLIRQIGEGGMGVVYEAEQTEPIRRTVALKIVKPGMDSQRVLSRFEAERNALALMDHPNIASVLEAGVADGGRPYFVMELVAGLPITKYCDQRAMGVQERARLLVTVCRAVQHAHQKGIIHRDLKPSNVLVVDTDGVPTPKVIDFGVAKAVETHAMEDSQITQVGHAVGTPLYMSPEQARFENSDVDTRSDVYSLGVLFYELLTSTTPVLRSRLADVDLHELRHVIRHEEPPRPSTRLRELGDRQVEIARTRHTDPRGLIQSVRGDLDQIVGRALAKDRNQRYPTANALARDIERHLDHRPIEATSPSQWYRLRRFAQRHRTAMVTVLLISLVLLIAASAGVWQARRTANALQMAESAARRLSELLYVSDMKVASDAWQDNDPPRVSGLLRRHFPEGEADDFRHFEWYYLAHMVDVPHESIGAARDDVESIRFSPDRQVFAAAGRDGVIRLYDADSRAALCSVESGQDWVNDLAFSPDSRRLVSAGEDGTLRFWTWNGKQLEPQRTISAHEDAARAVAFAGEGSVLVSGGSDQRLCLWDPEHETAPEVLTGHTRGIEAVAVSPDGWSLASAANDGTLRLWDLRKRAPTYTYQHENARVVCVAFSPEGDQVAAGDIAGNVILGNVSNNRSRLLTQQLDGIECLVFLEGQPWLATGDRGGSIQLWPLSGRADASLNSIQATNPRWQAHASRVTALALCPDGTQLVSGSRSGRLRLWSARPTSSRWSFGGEARPIRDFALTESGELLAASDRAGIEVWNLDRRVRIAKFGEGEPPWQRVAVSPLRDVAVTSDTAGNLVAWDLGTQNAIQHWASPEFVEWERIEFANDGNTFAVAAWDRQTQANVFQLDAPDLRWQVPAKQSKCLAFNALGDHLAVAWEDDCLVCRWAEQAVDRRQPAHENTLSDLAYSPDGRWLATVGHDRKLRLWAPDTAEERYAIVAHRDWIRSVSFSPDGWSLATAGKDGVVKIWHVETGQLLLVLPIDEQEVLKVRFTPDGRRLICLTDDDRIVIYDSRPVGSQAEE